MTETGRTDLVVLAADRDMKAVVDAVLKRSTALRIRPIIAHVHAHPGRDPGVCSGAHQFLRSFIHSASYCIVMFDHEGCGCERDHASMVEARTVRCLEANGWQGRCAAIVIDPELETWIWSTSPRLDQAVGWNGPSGSMRQWLKEEGRIKGDEVKPQRPKETLELVLKRARTPRSSALYAKIAGKVSVSKCEAASFARFVSVLQSWFPA